MPIDLTIIAIVFALVLLLVFFSAVVLYLSFRIKETFRKETRRGATIAKTAFLIGILFLAGGIFYFFANTFVAINQPANSPSTSPTNSPFQTPTPSTNTLPNPTPITTFPPTSISPSPSNSPPASGNPSASPSPTTAPTPAQTKPSWTIAFPPTAKMNSSITITFTIINPLTTSLQDATIQTNTLLQELTVKSSNYPIVGNVINVGVLQPGTTIVSLQLLTANRPQSIDDTASLIYQGMSTQISQRIVIAVRGN